MKNKIEKNTKEDCIEIIAEGLYIKVPREQAKITQALNILKSFQAQAEKRQGTELTLKEAEDIANTEYQKSAERGEELPEPPLQEQNVITLNPERYTICPLCSGKLKKGKVKQDGNSLIQTIKCKNRKCSFFREYIINI